MKKGIPARELRPYSMEDPFGLGIESPSQKKLHERFHRKSNRKRPLGRNHPEHEQGAEHTASEPRQTRETREGAAARRQGALPQGAPSLTAKATEKKSSNWGCVVTLAVLAGVLAVLWAVGQLVVPLIFGAIQQELVLQTGSDAYGRILKAEATDVHVNESTVYELTVEVHPPGQPAYQVEFEQALEQAQAAEARPGAWSTLRYDEADRDNIVLQRLGVDPPATNQADSNPIVKWDVRASASATVQTPPTGATPAESPSAKTTRAVAASAPDRAKSDSAARQDPPAPGRSSAASPSPSTSAASAAAPESAAAIPGAAAKDVPATASPPTILPICRRASACCTLAGGASCGQFLAPGKEKRECNRAYTTFSKQATASGNACK